MTISEIVKIVDGQLINNNGSNEEIKNIKIDTRMIEIGDLFIAIKGLNFNGHNFIEEAISKGAAAVIVETDLDALVPVIKVKDTLDSLMRLGNYIRLKYHDIPLIAVTGSVGKTMTKELISLVLGTKYNVLKSEKNYNNHIGLPLTLFNLNDSHEMIVAELGMNHLNEISRLSSMCLPDIGVITNIGSAHIGNLGSKKNVFRAKMEIIDGINNGYLLLNGNDKYLKKVKSKKVNVIKCGIDILKPFDIRLYNNRTKFKLRINNDIYDFESSLLGDKLVNNIILAIAVGLLYSVDISDMQKVLKEYTNIEKRLNIYEKATIEVIDDCYNASFESIDNSLGVLNSRKYNKVVILGDVLELGQFSKKYHIKIGKLIKKIKNCLVILVGTEVKNIKIKGAKYFDSNEEVINYLKSIDINNRSILLKGSRKMKLEEVRDYLLNDFNL